MTPELASSLLFAGIEYAPQTTFRAQRFGSAMRPRIAFEQVPFSKKRREDAHSATLRAGSVRTPKVRLRTDSSPGELRETDQVPRMDLVKLSGKC